MKKSMKIAAIASSAVIGLTAIGLGVGFGVRGCGGNGGSTNVPSISAPVNPIPDKQQHYVTGGLHKVNVTPSSRAFVTNGSSAYKIVIGSNSAEITEAASFLQKYVQKATGAILPIMEYSDDIAFAESARYIAIGCDAMFASANLSFPTDDIGLTGYYVKTTGNSAFLQTKGVYGYQNAVLAFMRHVLGYEMYSRDIVTFDNRGETLPDLDIVERPDFELHVPSQPVSAEAEYGMGFLNRNELFISVEGRDQHNSTSYLPPSEYNNPDKIDTYHEKWYSTIQRDADKQQLCYNARGDEGEYNAMVDAVVEKMKQLMEANPDVSNIGFTQQDGDLDCECDACKAMNAADKYGSAGYSAGIVKFCNSVSRKVQMYLQEKADETETEKREFNIVFFAYGNTDVPPAKLVDGKWQPIDDTVKCDANVFPYIAPINAVYNKSFYDEDNASEAAKLDGWAACSDKIFYWLYETNYSCYLFPYNTIIETYRYCFSNGAKYMYSEGQHNQPIVTHFTKFKEYLNSKAMFDVNVHYKGVYDDFFENYFREAAEPMRAMFDEMQAQLRYLETTYPEAVRGSIFDEVEEAAYWPKRMLDRWEGYIDEAYAAIESYKTHEPELYEVLYNNILLESIFPRFAQIHLHSAYYSTEQLRDLRVAFKADADKLNITRYDENATLASVYSGWNI